MNLFPFRLLSGAALVALTFACKTREADPATPGGGQAGRGGRGAPSITLTAADIAVVGRDTIEEATSVSGELRPIESVEVRARIEGDIIGVYAREGQRVTASQLLARFESSDQESGTRSAEAERAAAESEVANAQWNLDQSAELLKAGAISQRDHRAAEQTLAAARARLAAAESRVRATSSTERDTRVLSPTTGVVALRRVENGEHVTRGAALFTIVRSDVLELSAQVPSRAANSVRVGQQVHIVADGRRFTGRIARVSPTIDPATRSGVVYAEIPNRDGSIKSGTFATGRIVNRVLARVLAIPLGAVRQSQSNAQPFVYRVHEGTIAVAPLQLGAADERRGLTEVLAGLSDGDTIVVGNVGNLGRGMRVNLLGDEQRGGRSGERGTSSPRGR